MKIRTISFVTVSIAALSVAAAGHGATLVGSYFFNNTLTSSTAGGPTLVATDPLGTSGYTTSTVNSVTRTVYTANGAAAPASQGGLTFNGTGLLSNANGYSVALTFEFLDSNKNGGWRRILDTLDRTSDAGFYDDPANKLDIFPESGETGENFLAGTYHNVVLVFQPNGTSASAYFDQSPSFTTTTTTPVALSATDQISLFLDNTAGGGQGEWSSANIATAEFFDGALTPAEAEAFTGAVPPPPPPPPPPGLPEPATWAMMLLGVAGTGAAIRRAREQAATARLIV